MLWELESYNSWNLPFAKTVKIQGADATSSVLPLANYLLSVDPSAYFSVIFELEDIQPIT